MDQIMKVIAITFKGKSHKIFYIRFCSWITFLRVHSKVFHKNEYQRYIKYFNDSGDKTGRRFIIAVYVE